LLGALSEVRLPSFGVRGRPWAIAGALDRMGCWAAGRCRRRALFLPLQEQAFQIGPTPAATRACAMAITELGCEPGAFVPQIGL
jgi:hypothetical protein